MKTLIGFAGEPGEDPNVSTRQKGAGKPRRNMPCLFCRRVGTVRRPESGGSCSERFGSAHAFRPRRRADGAVTILMTVVFMLMMSLILVSLESARQQGAVAMFQMNVQTAAESVLGSYYAPLFDQYDLYALYDVDIAEEVKAYVNASAKPNEGKPADYLGETSSYYSYAYEVADVALTESIGLLDGGTGLCRRQMISAGAISGVEELAELLLNAVKLLKDAEQSSEGLELEQKLERELSIMDVRILELMKYLDGVPTDKNGVILEKDGTIKPVFPYAKRMVPSEIRQESVHMNNSTFYGSLEPYYYSAESLITEIRDAIESGSVDLHRPVPERVVEKNLLLTMICREEMDAIDEAVGILDDLIELQEKYKPMVNELEEYLETAGPLLNKDLYSSLQDSLKLFRNYVGFDKNIPEYNFTAMRQRLLTNRQIFEEVFSLAKQEKKTFLDWRFVYNAIAQKTEAYSIESLQLDYSKVKKSDSSNSGLWATIKSVITEGITGGVYGNDISLSDASIVWARGLPSGYMFGDFQNLCVIPGMSNEGSMDRSFLENVMDGNLLSSLLDRLADGIVDLSEKLLLITYFATHMTSFADPDEAAEGVLHYEQEYLLFGKSFDADNQRSATLSILGLRTIMNLIHVLVNGTKRSEALLVATEILALIPLPVLIKIAQYLILVVWAIQNAYLETAELLRGKAVPVLVTESTFQLSMADAFTMTRSRRINRAKEYQPPPGFRMKYEHYLWLLMLFKNSDTLTARALDIIQVNLQAGVDEKFRIENCIYGFGVEAEAMLPSLYTDLVPPQDGGTNVTSYTIREKCAVSY